MMSSLFEVESVLDICKVLDLVLTLRNSCFVKKIKLTNFKVESLNLCILPASRQHVITFTCILHLFEQEFVAHDTPVVDGVANEYR